MCGTFCLGESRDYTLQLKYLPDIPLNAKNIFYINYLSKDNINVMSFTIQTRQ